MNLESPYGRLDRLLHRIAFANGGALQRALAEVEDGKPGIEAGAPAAPVFVAGLPRAGTTLLLSLLAGAPEFATHTYRDMPFVLCPELWSRLSRRFRKPAEERERAHGDGLAVGYDSPEAFEEILWLAHWPGHYRADRVLPWAAAERNAAFEAFFARHMRKLIAVRAAERQGPPPSRYLSKNNANIARLRLLPEIFPDCRIVVPVREPLSHARSLLRQHRRFRELHAHDGFARRYMAWLGHFEFGADLRPIGFAPGGPDRLGDPDTLDFWLAYWCQAHAAILEAADDPRLLPVDQAVLRAEPAAVLATLASALGIDASARIAEWAARVRAPMPPAAPGQASEAAPSRRAGELYRALRERCLRAPRPARSA